VSKPRQQSPVLIVSDFGAAEFSSAIARRVRTRELTFEEAHRAFANFDAWSTRETARVHLMAVDITAAENLLRRMNLPLRAPDALHIAMVQRLNAELFTLDAQMAACASVLGTRTMPA
jgi:predicted nucleic acid-binding protein